MRSILIDFANKQKIQIIGGSNVNDGAKSSIHSDRVLNFTVLGGCILVNKDKVTHLKYISIEVRFSHIY